MTKFAHADVLQGGLLAIKNQATQMLLLSGYNFGDSYATVQTKKLANVAMTSTDFTIAASGNNQALTTASGKTAVASASSQQYDGGTATGGSTTTLVDTSKSWATNAHVGRAVTIVGGTGNGQVGSITANTANTLTIGAAWAVAPDATSVYRISDDLHFAFTDGSAKVLWVTDELSNQAITAGGGNAVTFPALTYTNYQPT